jgi:hypothetical protein
MLFGGPVLACALTGPRRRALAALALPLLYWPIAPAVRDVAAAAGDGSTSPRYYAPLLAYLEPRARDARVEVPFTRNHWEVAYLTRRVAIARGWERQIDRKENALFYEGRLTSARYAAWLRESGIRFVAVPDAPLDYSARAEARLIASRPPYLRPVWRSAHWRVLAVHPAPAMASGPARVRAVRNDELALAAQRPGRVVVRVRFTPYWRIERGAGCVGRAPGGWTEVELRRSGAVRLGISFALPRAFARGPRCAP